MPQSTPNAPSQGRPSYGFGIELANASETDRRRGWCPFNQGHPELYEKTRLVA